MRGVVFAVAVLLLTACGSGSDPVAQTPSSPTTSTSTAAPTSGVPRYSVVGEFDKWRRDRQPTYWIAVDPPDLSNDGFKNTVKAILLELATKNGDPDFTALVSEDRALAQWDYDDTVGSPKSCEIGQPCAIKDPNDKDKKRLFDQRLVAHYSGGEGTSTWKYELAWYPWLPSEPSPIERTEIARQYQDGEKWRPFPEPTTPPRTPATPLNGDFYFVKPYGQHDDTWSIRSTCDAAEHCSGQVKSAVGWTAPITKAPGAPWIMTRQAADTGWDCGPGGQAIVGQNLRADMSYSYNPEDGRGTVTWIAPPGACGSPDAMPFESRFGLKS
jgi:hypothetical protein